MKLHPLILAAAALCAACTHGPGPVADTATTTPVTMPLRLATYNTSLYQDSAGALIARLEAGDPAASKVAAVLQHTRPDIVLLNEFDYDPQHRAADLFQQRYLGIPQPGGGEPLHYAYRYLAPVNTGVASGMDLDNDGQVGGEGRAYGNDAYGYGLHPGQYGMLILSRYPIDADAVRSFQLLKWHTLPGARRPMDPATGKPFWPDAVWENVRLSSKSHWDVPVNTPAGTVHVLASHPTPPAFNGPEKRNVARNADELRLWAEYLKGESGSTWLCDDAGRCGGLPAGERFVIVGDLNNDPNDGNGINEAIVELVEHPRVLRMPTPTSAGAVETNQRYATKGLELRGNPAHATGDFGPRVGALRLDYVLPSTGFTLRGNGVFWPASQDPLSAIANASDHHLVWVDVE